MKVITVVIQYSPVLFADDGEVAGPEEDEEELQRRLVQLLNLPTALPSETLLTEDAEQSHADKVKRVTLISMASGPCPQVPPSFPSLAVH